MKLLAPLLILGLLAPLTGPNCLHADDSKPIARSQEAPNAAGIYWIAFAAFPTLTADESKLLADAVASTTPPRAEEITPLVARWRTALHELHRARAVLPCDWQLDVEAGPNLLLSHLQKARELSRVALVRARLRFAAGETDAAVSDVLDVFKLARDCGSSPVLIAWLVDVAIEKMATDVLAAHLPMLKPEQLTRLEAALLALPPSSSLVDCVAYEKRLFGGWLTRTIEAEIARHKDSEAAVTAIVAAIGLEADLQPKPDDEAGKRKAEFIKAFTQDDLRESLRRLHADYYLLTRIVAMRGTDRDNAMTRLEADLKTAAQPATKEDALRYFSASLLPTVKNVMAREDELAVRRELLIQAVRVQREGPSALKPFQGKPIEYQQTPIGFDLRYPSHTTLNIGRAP
jgi:hypothetical protein